MLKKWFIPGSIIILSLIMILFSGYSNSFFSIPTKGYKVYLDGKDIGLIDSKDELYELINNEQKAIKEKYKVDNVYPPKGFDINSYVSYDENFTTSESIYNVIKTNENFTVLGYVVTIKYTDNTKENKIINVLDKKVFEDAITNIVTAFVTYDEYINYLNDTQPEIVDIGKIIETMYFDETITIKQAYINVNDDIYTDSLDLTHYLLFGDNIKAEKYTVQLGDTISSIAEANKLNSQEFLIANMDLKLRDETSLLAIGQQVSIALINPILSLTYDVTQVEDTTVYFEKDTKYDYSKSSSYKVITQEGVNGITRNTQKLHIINGETQKAIITNSLVIREPITEITTRGRKYYSSGQYIDTGGDWKWPTNSQYIITSPFGFRKGTIHEGIDISGTGYGSPIYAAKGGIVAESYWQRTGGKVVIIDHQNGYFTMYAHLANQLVTQNQVVNAGAKIGTMGCSGTACRGTHLHFGVYAGRPYYGGRTFNPLELYQ